MSHARVLLLTIIVCVGFVGGPVGASATPAEPVPATTASTDSLDPGATSISFEEASRGASKPVDPWYLTDTNGEHVINDTRASDGVQSLYLHGSPDLGSVRANLDVNLTGVAEIKLDAYVEQSDPFFGDIKVNVDDNDHTVVRLDDEDAGQWHIDLTGDVSSFSGEHTLVLWARGENNAAFFDHLRFYDAEGNQLALREVVVGVSGPSGTVVNAERNGGSARVTQDTWKGQPSNMIDGEFDTKWQVAGQPANITAIYELNGTARVTADRINVGLGGGRDVTEYLLYTRNSSDESWEHAVTVSGSVTDDGTANATHEFQTPIVGQQFKLVITEHTPPELCLDACDVPIFEYQLYGTFVDEDKADGVTVEAVPTDRRIAPGETTTVDMVVRDVTDGIGAYNVSLAAGNASVATLEAVELGGDPGVKTVTWGEDNSSVSVSAATADTADVGSVTVLEVTVQAGAEGTSTLDLTVHALGDEGGNPIEVGRVLDSDLAVRDVSPNEPGPGGAPPSDLPAFSETVPLDPDQTTPESLAGVIRVEPDVKPNTSVKLTRNTSTNYTLSITVTGNATDVTFYLQQRAISSAQNISNVVMRLDSQNRSYFVDEDAGPGRSPWVAFTVPEFSTRSVSFVNPSAEDELPPVVGDATPTDPDGDGAYEDVNGDGSMNVIDVQALFANLNSAAVQDNPSAYDYNGDGTVNVIDVQALFVELSG